MAGETGPPALSRPHTQCVQGEQHLSVRSASAYPDPQICTSLSGAHYVSAAKSLELPKCISVLFCLQGNGCYPNCKQILVMVLHFQLMYDLLPLFENCAGFVTSELTYCPIEIVSYWETRL